MTLIEAYPAFTTLHTMQPRLDKAGHTVEQFVQDMAEGKNPHHQIPPEIYKDPQLAIRFMSYFGQAYLCTLLAKTYPL